MLRYVVYYSDDYGENQVYDSVRDESAARKLVSALTNDGDVIEAWYSHESIDE